MTKSGYESDATTWQSLRVSVRLMAIASVCITSSCFSQLFDPLDTHPPRWFLDESDCEARLTQQTHLIDGGVSGGACESVHFIAGNGSEAQLVYPIEPVLPIDDLTANVKVMSAKPGASIGFRVRFPYVRDPVTKKAVSVIIYGASYQSPGEFASIGIGLIEKPLRLKYVALRSEYGLRVDLADPYVDAVVINAYSGPGQTAIRLDELRVDGMLSVGREKLDTAMRGERGVSQGDKSFAENLDARMQVFPTGQVTRILQYNGEPLRWVRSLGFDAILCREFPSADLLREAIQSRLVIYSEPPEILSSEVESLLEPIAGWYLGRTQVLDEAMLEQTEKAVRRLRSFPPRWNRPIVGAPVESWRRYAPLLDGVIQDLPPRERSLNAYEELDEVNNRLGPLGDRVVRAVGLMSMPPDRLLIQNDTIADSIGAPRPESFHWHAMWLQAMRSLESIPSAIVFRSTRSLASGQPLDAQRAMAISYVNRMIAMIAPWVASASNATPPVVQHGSYRCCRLSTETSDLLILTSTATRGTEVLGGDGESIELQLTPSDATKSVWRLTHFSAERMSPEVTEGGSKLEIVSPDVVEVLCLSSDTKVGGQVSASAAQFARQATMDRWQLVNESLVRSESRWVAATSMNLVPEDRVSNLVQAAQRTMVDAEPMFRSGDLGSTLRMARRADAWLLRSGWQLSEILMPDWPNLASSPPVVMGASELQVFWRSLMQDQGWGRNRLTSGSMDEIEFFGEGRWTVGKRLTERAESKVNRATLGTFAGPGALRASVVSLRDDPLPGGYEGTVLQLKSPSVRLDAGTAFRIDAWVKTIGFGGPHQGVLVYDTVLGPELGVLVRNAPTWTPVRLYRQAETEGEVQVMFELLGAGEVMIDEVELRIWEPRSGNNLPLQPLDLTVPRSDSSNVVSQPGNLQN
jgi:hypothetical protein